MEFISLQRVSQTGTDETCVGSGMFPSVLASASYSKCLWTPPPIPRPLIKSCWWKTIKRANTHFKWALLVEVQFISENSKCWSWNGCNFNPAGLPLLQGGNEANRMGFALYRGLLAVFPGGPVSLESFVRKASWNWGQHRLQSIVTGTAVSGLSQLTSVISSVCKNRSRCLSRPPWTLTWQEDGFISGRRVIPGDWATRRILWGELPCYPHRKPQKYY